MPLFVATRVTFVTVKLRLISGRSSNGVCAPGHVLAGAESDHREQTHAFSPDGKKIAFATSRHFQEDILWSAEWDIYVMNADGSNETRLTENGGHAPTFSPDGTKIAIANHTYQFNENGIRYDENGMPDENGERLPYARVTDIYAMNADGSDETRLTNTSSAIDLRGAGPRTYAEMDAYPAFSPDGTRIAFSQSIRMYDETGEQESLRGDIYIMKADSTDLVNLTNDLAQMVSTYVSWGPEAKMETLAPSGGPNILLPAAVLLLGAGLFGYAVLRGI